MHETRLDPTYGAVERISSRIVIGKLLKEE